MIANASGEPELWLQLVGGFAVYRRDRLHTVIPVGSRKARALLALLAVERGRLVPIDRMIEAAWGDSPPRRPADNVATLVSRLRSVLGPAAVEGGRTGYRLGARVRVDLYEAEAMLVEAEARLAHDDPRLALVIASRAGQVLDGGAVLTEVADPAWAERARIQHAELVRRAAHAVAHAALAAGDARAAQLAAAAAVAADPFDEVAYRALMQAHDAAGEPARALDAYRRLQATLSYELGIDPAQATRDVYVAVLRNQAVTPPAREPARARPVTGKDGLVGRGPELARLAAAWKRAAAGSCQLLLITGEAGIGKTRFADQAVRLAAAVDGRVVRAGCRRTERSLPLRPVLEALASLVTRLPVAAARKAVGDSGNVLAALVPEVGAKLGMTPGEAGGSQEHWRQRFDVLATILRRLSAARPMLLVVDDLHDADPMTLQWLHYLARHASSSRLLLIGTVRVEESEPVLTTLGHVSEVIELGPLDTAAIRALALAAGQQKHVGRIEEQTGGHTLCVVETLRALAAGEAGIPRSLRTAVMERVRRAGRQAGELLRAAAVLGAAFTPADLAPLLDISVPEAARRCERILPARLIVVAGNGYAFANELIQRVLYDAVSPPTHLAYTNRTKRDPPRTRLTPLRGKPDSRSWGARGWPLAERSSS